MEKHTKATPGPWSWAKCDGEIWIETSEGKAIAEVVPRVEAVSDAQLISAAPDLLEALKEAIKDEEIGRMAIAGANEEMGFDPPKKLAWVEKAEQAIAKATQP